MTNSQVRMAASRLRLQEFDPASEKNQKLLKTWDDIRYYTGEHDEIEKKLADALRPVEQVCRDAVAEKALWKRWRERAKPPGL